MLFFPHSGFVLCSKRLALFFSFSPQLSYFFPPVTLFFSFSPQLRYLLCFRGKNSVTGGKNTKIAQDIYYIKQTLSYAIFPATLFWNSTGHLLHKTNPDLSYFELSYVFWGHIDSVGRGTTVQQRKYRKRKISTYMKTIRKSVYTFVSM